MAIGPAAPILPQTAPRAAFDLFSLDAVDNLAEIAPRDLNIQSSTAVAGPNRGIGRNVGLLAGDPLNSRPRQAADLGKSVRRHFERSDFANI